MRISGLVWCSLLPYCYSFIIPNEIPTILSVIYSNIPPLKIGIDTRFGYGFRLGNHVDYQSLVEIGPQTNTNPISSNGTLAKRQSFPLTRLGRLYGEGVRRTTSPSKESQRKRTVGEKKSQRTVVGGVQFKKVPGIDENVSRKGKPKSPGPEKRTPEELPAPVHISLL